MKIINLYKRFVCRAGCLLALPVLLCGCFYEHPELTPEGERGIDPTFVTLNANLLLHLKMPALEEGGTAIGNPASGQDASKYRRRFIVEAYIDRTFAARQVVYQEIDAETAGDVALPVSMKLHARSYELAVWADYVPVSEEGTVTDDYFYNTESGHLASIYNSQSYYGSNEFKDAFCGSAAVDLEEFRDEWGAKQRVDIELSRPVGRVQFIANDVAAFLKQHAADGKKQTFVVRLSYNDYLNVGYNVLERLPRHGLLYMKCDRTFTTDELVAGEPFTLAFDYLFAPDGENVSIPVTVEIWDKDVKNVLAAASFSVACRAGFHTDVTYGFLTADPDGGITFDPGFDGTGEIEVPAQPQGEGKNQGNKN